MSDPVPVARVGNITDHPELRHGKGSGKAFATFGLAYRPYVPKGEPEPQTTFYEVVTFRSLAEHVAASLSKGDRVLVVGKGEIEHWTGKDGVDRTKRKIIGDAVGPDLRFVDVEIQRAEQGASAGQASFEEPPF